LWPEDTHVNRSASQDNVTVPTTNDICGPCSPTAFAWYDPDTHCWKTFQGTFLSGSDQFSQTWPRSGMTHDGIAYQLPPSARRTSAIAFSLSQGAQGPNSDGLWPTATTGDHTTRFAQGGMPLGMAARMWPTPDASPHKYRLQGNSQQSRSLNGIHGGKLNPMWVEWLMGFPIGWTDCED
jgi:hypothetical protein